MNKRGRIAVVLVASALCLACESDPLSVFGQKSHVIRVHAGELLAIRLGTAGPGGFEASPSISSHALRFLETSPYGDFASPAGARQQFLFEAESTGLVTVHFHHINGFGNTDLDVTDTVVVVR
jgi:hypothetical protein